MSFTWKGENMKILNLELGINENTGETYVNINATEGLMIEEDAKEVKKVTDVFVKGVYKILEKNLENMEA